MRPILLSAMLLNLMVLQACASWPRQGSDARPTVNLAKAGVPTLPSTPSPFGLSERERPHASVGAKAVDIDQYLAPRGRATQLAAKHALTRKQPTSRSAAAPAALVANLEPTPIPALAPQPSPQEREQDATRYAQRERQAPGLESFQGGDAVVITMSTLVVVLLIVLLIVLIVN
jgi:hypothetical protein